MKTSKHPSLMQGMVTCDFKRLLPCRRFLTADNGSIATSVVAQSGKGLQKTSCPPPEL